MRGKVGADGMERVTTQMLFDIFEIPQRAVAGACRRLAKLMANWAGSLCGSEGSLVAVIGSRFVATAAMPGTGAIPTVDRDRRCAARIHAFLNNSALPAYGPCNQERALFGLFKSPPFGIFGPRYFQVLSIYRKKG